MGIPARAAKERGTRRWSCKFSPTAGLAWRMGDVVSVEDSRGADAGELKQL